MTRLLRTVQPSAKVVEVHPTAALALRGAPIEAVRSFKKSPAARLEILNWFEGCGLRNIEAVVVDSDHAIAACAAALAAWKWQEGESAWIHKAEPLIHPFDFHQPAFSPTEGRKAVVQTTIFQPAACWRNEKPTGFQPVVV